MKTVYLKKCLTSLLVAAVCVVASPATATEQSTQFVKYKNYLIPVQVTEPPAAPAGVSATSQPGGVAQINWQPVAEVSRYEVQVYNPDTGLWETVYSGPNTQAIIANLPYGVNSFRVRACTEQRCGFFTTTNLNLQLTGDTGSNSVGAVAGEGGVSGGSAYYQIPITVPPGRKGVQPNVSLSYSSRGGNGVAGVGWSLSGGSSIHRCSATVAQDGFSASVQYSESRDRLCLNGQRLMKVNGGNYGTSGSEYRTELDQFARIKQFGAINSGSSYFTVESKDGMASRYGTSASSRHRDARQGTYIKTWAIEESKDRSGNSLHYDYANFSEGEHLLTAIHYTGTNATRGDRHVRFNYENRSDPVTTFLAGGKSRQTKRLKSIDTQYQNQLVRRYSLNYGAASQSSQRTLLRSVQECAYKNGGSQAHCLPATTFNWQEGAQQFTFEPLQFKNTNGSTTRVHADKRWLNDILPRGDVNGDGVRDWTGIYVNAEGQITGTHSNVISNCFRKSNSFTTTCLEGDFDSDGLTDSFMRDAASGSFAIRHADNGALVTTNITWPQSSESYPIGFNDFNGDGWIDVAFRQVVNGQDGDIWIYTHTQNKSVPYVTANRVHVADVNYSGSANGYTKDYQILGDVDGNGYVDFFQFDTGTSIRVPGLPFPEKVKRVFASNSGVISFNELIFSGHKSAQAINANYFHDVNGDGLPDWLAMENQQGLIHYRLNNGNGFDNNWINLGLTLPTRMGSFNLANLEPDIYSVPVLSKVITMDYNGDGRQEVLVAGAVKASSCAYLQQAAPESADWFCDDDLYKTIQTIPFAPNETQINSQILDDSARNYQALRFFEKSNGEIGVVTENTNITASATQTAVVDATGDGLPDIVTAFGCRFPETDSIPSNNTGGGTGSGGDNTGPGGPGGGGPPDEPRGPPGSHPLQIAQVNQSTSGGVCAWNSGTSNRTDTVQDSSITAGAYINRNRGAATGGDRYQAHDMLKSVTNGLGVKNEWEYRPLSSGEYNRTGSVFYKTDTRYAAADANYFHFASSMYVVAESKESNGIGGLNSTKYRYRGAIYNTRGRGFQGFRTIIEENDAYATFGSSFGGSGNTSSQDNQGVVASADVASIDTVTRTDYHQFWPRSGIVQQSCTWLANENKSDDNPSCSGVLSKTVSNTISDVATAGGARFVAPTKTTETSYKLADRSLLNTRVNEMAYDAYGNVTDNQQAYSDSYTSVTTNTVNSYVVNTTNWWLNKMTKRVVTNSPVQSRHASSPVPDAGTDAVKVLTVNYEYDNTHRLPNKLTTTANDSTLNSVVDTTYTPRGLPSVIETSGTHVVGPRRITTAYSGDGYFVTSLQNALGHTGHTTTDPRIGQVLTQTDANSLTAVNTYDAFGRPESVNAPGEPIAQTRYSKCTSVSCPPLAQYKVTVVQDGSPDVSMYKDMFNRDILTSSRSFSSRIHNYTAMSYNRIGQKLFESVPYSAATPTATTTVGTHYGSYDALGRLLSKSVDQASGQPFTTNYTHDGFKTTIAAQGDRIVDNVRVPTTLNLHRIYNGLEQLVETKDANGGLTKYSYDGSGNPIVMQDANGTRITSNFNALGHKQWVNDPNMGVKNFTYTGLGEVLTETDANGDRLSYTYDVLGRIIERKVKRNGETSDSVNGTWVYDAGLDNKGLLISEDSGVKADGSKLTKTFEYTPASTGRKLPSKVTHRIHSSTAEFQEFDVSSTYDPTYGRLTNLVYPTGLNVGLDYNRHGYLTKEKNAASGHVYREVRAMDARNLITSSRLTNGRLLEQVDYASQTGQMRGITVKKANELRHSLNYYYDDFGNLHARETTHGVDQAVELFEYDKLHRVTKSTRSYQPGVLVGQGIPNDVINYSYDAVGNLLSKSDYANNYIYGGAGPNAVSQVTLLNGDNVDFFYDQNGNMTAGHNKTLSYDVFNKPLRIVSNNAANDSSFEYGADIMRYKKTEIGTSNKTTFYIDKLMEVVIEGDTTKSIAYVGGTAVVTQTQVGNAAPTESTRYLLKGRLGSTITITDEDGEIRETNGFDPFGRPLTGLWQDKASDTLDSEVTTRGYTGHEHLDESKLIHMNGRAYDYQLGRFLGVDPFIQEPGNSQSMNPYSYIMNNPLAGTDPTGYMKEDEIKLKETKFKVTGSNIVRKGVKATNTETGRSVTLKTQGDVKAAGLSPNGASNSQGAGRPGADSISGNGSNVNVGSLGNRETSSSNDPSSTGYVYEPDSFLQVLGESFVSGDARDRLVDFSGGAINALSFGIITPDFADETSTAFGIGQATTATVEVLSGAGAIKQVVKSKGTRRQGRYS